MKYIRNLPSFFAALTILISLMGIAGWLLHVPVLYNFFSVNASMKFNTALGMLLLGIAVLNICSGKALPARVAAFGLLLISGPTLAEHLLQVNLGIDELLIKDSSILSPKEPPGRISILSAIAFFTIGIGIEVITLRHYFWGQLIILLQLLLVYSSLMGIIFNVSGLFQFGIYSAISFPTALGLLSASLGILAATRHRGWLPEIAGRHTAAIAARYGIFYFLIITPVFIGVFLLMHTFTMLPVAFAIILLIMGTAVFTMPFAYFLLRRLNRTDRSLLQLTTDLQERTQQLAYSNKELTHINKNLDNILHIVTHDLKNPITSLQTSLQLLKLKLEPKADEKEIRLLEIPVNAVARLKEKIEDLGQTIRAQRPGEAPLENIDVCHLVENLKMEMQSVISSTGAIVQIDADNCVLFYRRIHLHSILQNLLSNALKYRFPGRVPHISIKANEREDGMQLIVEDNGLGLSETQLQRLFNKYQRFHEHVEGTGVGLYLTKQLIEAEGGSITVESEEGKGTRFTLFFKKPNAHIY